ncbi:hypothetical protein ACKFKF_33720 [Phormidesmis sp. 146-12]
MMTVDDQSASSPTLGQVIDRILSTGYITSADQNYLRRAVLSEIPLSQTEQSQVRRLTLWEWVLSESWSKLFNQVASPST